MKKAAFAMVFIVVLIILSGCTSTPAAPDELDLAIRDASDYLDDNIPARSKIAILNIQSDYAVLSEYIIDELIANAVNDRNFSVVDRAQLDAIRMELNFQLSGEVSDDSALEIGKFLGAQTIVSGALGELGDRYRMTIRALNVQTAEVQGQFNRNITSSQTVTSLKSGRGYSGTSYGQTANSGGTSGNRQTASGSTAQTAQLQAGTYTFTPRIQATKNGIPSNDYISKIVIRGNNMLIYLTRTPRGGGAPEGYNGWRLNDHNMLTDLDRPSRSWKRNGFSADNSDTDGIILSFENVSARRFSLDCEWERGVYLFEEITLGEPDK